MKTRVPTSLTTADVHVDKHADDPYSLTEVENTRGHIRIMPAMHANELHKRLWRREKRRTKNMGQRHARRTAKHALHREIGQMEGDR